MLVVAVAAAVWAGGFTGSEHARSAVVRGDEGWTLTYPGAFHRRAFDISDPDWSAHGVAIGNFQPLPAAENGKEPRVPRKGVLFQLFTLGGTRHLLVTESVGYFSGCAASLAHHVPACPNYQPVSSSSRTS